MLVYNWIMEKLDIYQLREIILFWIASTSILLFCGISCLEGLIESVFFLIKECPWLLNQYITAETWVYFIMLIMVGICSCCEKRLWRRLVKFYEKNHKKQRRMHKEHEVFIAYLNLLLTIVLQAFHFEGAEDTLVKALFYSTGILTISDKIREKAGKEKS